MTDQEFKQFERRSRLCIFGFAGSSLLVLFLGWLIPILYHAWYQQDDAESVTNCTTLTEVAKVLSEHIDDSNLDPSSKTLNYVEISDDSDGIQIEDSVKIAGSYFKGGSMVLLDESFEVIGMDVVKLIHGNKTSHLFGLEGGKLRALNSQQYATLRRMWYYEADDLPLGFKLTGVYSTKSDEVPAVFLPFLCL